MASIETTEERQAIVTPRLRLSFFWTGDRWAHLLERADSRILAASVEGEPRRDDPARVVSPAYQQLGFQKGASGVQALLVGQAGTHHFSAVFNVRETAEAVAIEVDVADRCRTVTEALACTYQVYATSGELRDAGPSAIVWEWSRDGRLALESSPPNRLMLAESGRNATQVQVDVPIQPEMHTNRCVYRWAWTDRNEHP